MVVLKLPVHLHRSSVSITICLPTLNHCVYTISRICTIETWQCLASIPITEQLAISRKREA